MAIKETPVNIKTYYRLMKEEKTKKLDDIIKEKDKLEEEARNLHSDVLQRNNTYKNVFKVKLNEYPEFVDNTYIDGKFLDIARGLFLNRGNDFKIVSDLWVLYNLAKKQENIHKLKKEIELCRKLINLSLKEYTEILRLYYVEVHKQLILKGNGYVFSHNIGWICVNRIVLRNPRPTLDYAATKKREAELKSQGKRIYNKDEADWCTKHGIEYKAEDKRVFRKDEYCYEIPLIGCKLPNGTKVKLEISDYRHTSLRGKTNDNLIELCNHDSKQICNLSIDLKTKLTLCDKANTILYTNFIRNENQQSITAPKTSSKNR